LEKFLDAKYNRSKKEILAQANIQLEKLRFFTRLARDLRFIAPRRYEYITRQINQIGIQLGGWLKNIQ